MYQLKQSKHVDRAYAIHYQLHFLVHRSGDQQIIQYNNSANRRQFLMQNNLQFPNQRKRSYNNENINYNIENRIREYQFDNVNAFIIEKSQVLNIKEHLKMNDKVITIVQTAETLS